MKIEFFKVVLNKRFPLEISRGVRSNSENLFVKIEKNGIVGWGESAPGESEGASNVDEVKQQLETFVKRGIRGNSISSLYDKSKEMGIAPCAYVAIDTALWDLKAKEAGLPLYNLLGFPKPFVPSSVTIGINSPKVDDVYAHHYPPKPPVNLEDGSSRKYKEDESIKALKDYVSSTYSGHYTSKNNNVQTLDLIQSVGDAESFCRSNAIKYLSRYDKKGQAKRDILKAMHYCLLLYYFSGNTNNETPTRGYETF